MRREGGIVLDKKDIEKTGLTKEQLHGKIKSFYEERAQLGIEKFQVRVFAKRRVIEIKFVGRSVVDADFITLQDFIFPAMINALATQA